MTYSDLVSQIKKKRSFLCVGLDTDLQKIPAHLLSTEDPIFEFNKAVVDATVAYAVAYKPNIAFYECYGVKGWQSLEKTVLYIKETYPDVFLIADAKRGDIGNTSAMYAKAFLENMPFDSITVAPYMGEDSVTPFLAVKNKWVILLALTSNKGAFDFQTMTDNGEKLYERVLTRSQKWANHENMMYVVGATKAEMLQGIRAIVPQHFLLVPGVGTQGGSLHEVARHGMNASCGLLVNSSRDIIYADSSALFDKSAGDKASGLQKQMEILLKEHAVI